MGHDVPIIREFDSRIYRNISTMLILACFILFPLLITGEGKKCPPNYFQCETTNKCIPLPYQCDNYFDCKDKSDEKNCKETCKRDDVFHCKNSSGCIPNSNVCNGLTDCKDGSDESNCTCPDGEFQCKINKNCINKKWICDGSYQCSDGSDEQHCTDVKIPITPSPNGCPDGQFWCRDIFSNVGKCKTTRFFCDGVKDCVNGADEPASCKKNECLDDEYRCSDGTCIPKDFLCDGKNDCRVNSITDSSMDEDKNECDKYSRCRANEFHCRGTTRCIELSQLCNDVNNCDDGSDEGPKCRDSPCPGGCEESCQPTPNGTAICLCKKGYQVFNKTKCKDINECEQDPKICSQQCVNTEGSYKCKCVNSNYELKENGFCRLKAEENEMIFVDLRHIYRYNMTKNSLYKLITNMTRGVALDYDILDARIFYTDVTENEIHSSFIKDETNDVNNEIPIISIGLAVPDGIAVDWVGKKVYFAESSAGRVDVMKYDGKYRCSLISSNLTNPRGLTLDPRFGYLFITDWGGGAAIFRSQMDGSNFIKLVTYNIGWPNGITIDYTTKRVYWIDAKFDSIQSMKYDGTNRVNIISGEKYVPHPFALTMDDMYIYFTDWVKKGVVRVRKDGNKEEYSILIHNLTRPMDIQIMGSSRQPRAKDPCKAKNAPKCKHICVTKNNETATCLCKIGYKMNLENKACEKIDRFLIFARSWEVRGISLDAQFKHDVITPVLGLSSAVGTDFDAKEGYVYFSDIKRDSIGRVHIEGGSMEWVHESNLESPEGIAVDWIAGNLYWTDAKINGPPEIGVSKLDGKYRKILYNKNLGKPRAIVLDPNRGYIFFTDWLKPAKICRLDMDGQNYTILVNGKEISWPNGLAIDSERLYWADASIDRIESINFDGSNRKIVYPSTNHSFGLAVDQNYIYWSDWMSKSIHFLPKNNSSNDKKSIRSGFSGLMGIKIYDRALQNRSLSLRYDSCSGLGCAQLCLLRPNGAVCACGEGYKLINNRICINTNVSEPTAFKCQRDYFQCNNTKCIKYTWICDGDDDCHDNSDEADELCLNRKCDEGMIQCNGSYKCIPKEWLCDGTNDCVDGSDETHQNCTVNTICKNKADFQCKDNKKCIHRRWRCDGENDCEDLSDEKECITHRCDDNTEFQCRLRDPKNLLEGNGPCVPRTWVCDGSPDCLDGSDELNAVCENCTKNYKQCDNARCIHHQYWCDGFDDCHDGSDEKYCNGSINYCQPEVFRNKEKELQLSSTNVVNCTCAQNEFQCNSSLKCIKKRLTCDFIKDCEDFSDEFETLCPYKESCSPSQFLCDNKRCISAAFRCDKIDDCYDKSDEKNCSYKKSKCESGHDFVCADGRCIPLAKVCNNIIDCPNGTDENGPGCKVNGCQINSCSQLCYNTPLGTECGCREGFRLLNDSFSCEDINECDSTEELCTHFCYNTKGSYKCKCAPGFVLRQDGRTCSAGGDDPLIIFSDHKNIQVIYPHSDSETKILVSNLKSAIGVDFHFTENRVYWTDVTNDNIERIFLNGTGREEIINQGMNSPEGIAIDWVTLNIYWTDMRLDTIEAARLDGSNRSVILSHDLDAPRALSLDPKRGFMFWTDWGSKPRIERADMDGNNRKLLTNESIIWPNGLTVDLDTQRVYFVDARLDTLVVMDYDGKNRKTVVRGGLIKHPFSLAVFEDNAYFTDWIPGSIRRISRRDGTGKKIYDNDLRKPMGIQVMHKSKQPIDSTVINYCEKARCSHLCLLRPNGYSCKCPFGFQLKEDDNQTCISVQEFLIYARRQEIRGISLDPKDTVDRITPITGTQNAIGVDFHYEKQYIYWTDVSMDSISRISVHGTEREDVIPSGLPAPDGIAIDWVADNLYWTDAERDRIEVARLDGRYRKVIVSSEMKQPRGIEVVPEEGVIIWTDWGNNKIEIALMDGSRRTLLVGDKVGYPNGVSYDFKSKRVFWCDAKRDTIEYINLFPLFGKNNTRGELKLESGKIVHPFGITVFDDFIYWTDWGRRAILRTNINGGNVTEIRSPHLSLMGLRIYHKDRQVGNNSCWDKSLCEHLCFALNSTDYTCGCATGYELGADNRTCKGSTSFLLFSTITDVRAISFDEEKSESESIVPILGLKSSYAIDFNFKSATIFIVDDNQDKIFKVQQDGSQLEPIVTKGLVRPQGIAVDWISENLYWTDVGTHLIEVSRLNGSHRLTLIYTELDSPRAIVVFPKKGLMFWTDWGNRPKIERAFLNGLGRKTLVNEKIMSEVVKKDKNITVSKSMRWPNGLTIDYKEEVIYWVDAGVDLLVKMDLNGENIKVLSSSELKHPYAITIFEGMLYITDWQFKAILKRPAAGGTFKTLKKDLNNIRDIHAYDKSRQVSDPNNPCGKQNGGCDQLCLTFPSDDDKSLRRKCYCATGRLDPVTKKCGNLTDFLIFAKRNEIQFLDMNPRRRATSPYKPIPSLHNAIDIDFNYERGIIYYSDIFKKAIGYVSINGSEDSRVLVSGLKTPDGVAYDWVNDRLYWTDAQENTVNRLINGTVKEILIHEELDEPRAIALSPCDGFMYWTDWGRKPYIKHATMDGYNPKAIVDTNLGWPNGLCVDMENSRIYWADARLDRIESADLTGNNRKIVVAGVPHVFGIAMLDNYIYWTDWVQRSVMRTDKNGYGEPIALIDKLDAQPMGIKVYSKKRQQCTQSPCYNNSNCKGTCTVVDGRPKCGCGKKKILLNGFRCVVKPTTKKCMNNDTMFICDDGNCTEVAYHCDGSRDCPDGSDEQYCETKICNELFRCTSTHKCIPKAWQCDLEKDCKDGSDEFNCKPVKNCTNSEFRCQNGKCIAKVFRCDGHKDCLDNSDELGCPPSTCKEGQFKCEDKTGCIRKNWLCDGSRDCPDGSDELSRNCIPYNCTSDEFKCTDGKCISKSWLCDGDFDCIDKSDENSCSKTISCGHYGFQCNNTVGCIPEYFTCDGQPDCPDGSDEDERCVKKKCLDDEYKCGGTKHCIPRSYLCDGDNDCGDGSDESPKHGCVMKECSKMHEFRCKNNLCISTSWKCDGEDDCGDNSDEVNCTCLQQRKFPCEGKCLEQKKLCDGKIDCSDGSDEENCKRCETFTCTKKGKIICLNNTQICNGKADCDSYRDEKSCFTNECLSKQLNNCTQHCIDLPQGYKCACHPGFYLKSDNRTCEHNCNEYEKNKCSQICVQSASTETHECACVSGYALAKNLQSCKHNSKINASLLIANKVYLNEMSLRKSDNFTSYKVIAKIPKETFAIDYHWGSQRYFWVEKSPSEIKWSSFNSNHFQPRYSLIKHDLINVLDLAVDWVGDNLYFTDEYKHSIYVTDLKGKYKKKLYTNIRKVPFKIVCHPNSGYLYFSTLFSSMDSANGTISRIGMDGSNPSEFVTKDVVYPHALAIDHVTDILYWTDIYYKRIEFVSLKDISKRRVLLYTKSSAHTLDIFEDFLYYSTYHPSSKLYRVNRFTGKNDEAIKQLKIYEKYYDITVKHPLKQLRKRNPCNRMKCDQLCLLSPNPTGYSCSCSEFYHLRTDNQKCVSNCTANEFQCSNFRCITRDWVCDGENDCGDSTGSDEKNCPTQKKCTQGMFPCRNGNCTRKFFICDGEDDCGDNSDELECEKRQCFNFQFRCKNHKCILRSRKCDKKPDCEDKSDESEEECKDHFKCTDDFFKCDQNKCIPNSWKCDDTVDCQDQTDENNITCQSHKCPDNYFKCDHGRCIMGNWKCDGDPDCPDGSDEKEETCQNNECNTSTSIKCDNNRCIPKSWVCDQERDCKDGTDEIGCNKNICDSANMFKCANNKCITKRWKCDGDNDCGDNSDEGKECKTVEKNCTENFFMCSTSRKCIPNKWKCDQETDCKDKSDEKGCPTPSTQCNTNEEFRCNDGSCIRYDWICDNSSDCIDGSDEDVPLCRTHNCNAKTQFQCENNKCIPIFKKCDGRRDCSNGEDELHCERACKDGEFKCKKGECIDSIKLCDYYKDCSNDNDESDCFKSQVKEVTCVDCKGLGTNCEQLKGIKWLNCTCKEGYKLDEPKNGVARKCVDVNECIELPIQCSQICINLMGKHACKCAMGYEHRNVENFTTCKVKTEIPYLIVPTENNFIIHKPNIKTYYSTNLDHLLESKSSLEFFHGSASSRLSMMLLLGDKKAKKIYGYKYTYSLFEDDGMRKKRASEPLYTEIFHMDNVQPEYLRADFVGNNLFWVDNSGKPSIYISTIDGYHKMNLVMSDEGKIEGLALSPELGKMFWVESNSNYKFPIIKRALMDGTNLHILVNDTIHYPVSLVVDNPSSRLFWADVKKHSIESIRFDGTARHVAIDSHRDPRLLFPHSIDVFEDHVYGIMKHTGSLFKVDKFGRSKMIILKAELTKTFQLRLRHSIKQHPVKVEEFLNPCKTHHCPQICVVIRREPKCLCDQDYKEQCHQKDCNREFCNRRGKCIENNSTKERTCQCENGYSPVQRCKKKCNCKNGGSCVSVKDNRDVCSCTKQFTGIDCSEKCHFPCINGNCTQDIIGNTCSCDEGWSGLRCDKPTCKTKKCNKQEKCIIEKNNAVCKFTGNCPNCVTRSSSSSNQRNIIVVAVVIIIVLLIVIVIGIICVKRRREYNQFAPKRIQNIEMDNPIYSNEGDFFDYGGGTNIVMKKPLIPDLYEGEVEELYSDDDEDYYEEKYELSHQEYSDKTKLVS